MDSPVGKLIVKGMFGGLRGRGILVFGVVACVLAGECGLAAAAGSTGEFAVFSECPTSALGVTGCATARLEGGSMTIGRETVPIVNAETLQMGIVENEETGAQTVVDPVMSRALQKVPGGLLGVSCVGVANPERCESENETASWGLWAAMELAEPGNTISLNEGNVVDGSGTGISLPVKIKLENRFLGSKCYIGSSAHPITLELTDGTSGSLLGHRGHLSGKSGGEIDAIEGAIFVDGLFAVPPATGCAFSGLGFNHVVDSRLGLPARPGTSKITLLATIEMAGARQVREHGT